MKGDVAFKKQARDLVADGNEKETLKREHLKYLAANRRAIPYTPTHTLHTDTLEHRRCVT